MKQSVLITGATGQAGSYLVDKCLEQDYEVYGLIRRSATSNTKLIDHVLDDIEVLSGDLTDAGFITESIRLIKPDFICNTAAQSHVGYSFNNPKTTFDVNLNGVLNLLEAIRYHSVNSKMVQFSSIVMDEPVLLRVNNKVLRTDLGGALKMWQAKASSDIFETLTATDDGLCSWAQITNVIDHGFREIDIIRFAGGQTLRVTPDHSLIVLKNNTLTTCTSADLKPGDKLLTFCMGVTAKPVSDYQHLKWDFSKAGYNWRKNYTKNLVLDEKLAYLVGMYCAEGCISNSTCTWTFGNTEFDVNRPTECMDIIKQKFDNIHVSVRNRSSSTQVEAYQRVLVSFLEKFVGAAAKTKRIPMELLSSPRDVQLAFLWGYAGDAHLNPRNGELRYTTVCRDMAVDLLWLLRSMGIAARFTKRYNKSHLSPQETKIDGSWCFDIIVCASENPFLEITLADEMDFSKCKTPEARCLPKTGFNFSTQKNLSRSKLRSMGNKFGNSDLGMFNVVSVDRSPIQERVGDFCIPTTERWFCGTSPVLVHNTSEMFGWNQKTEYYNEASKMKAKSPYGVSKIAAHNLVINYREAYNLWVFCCVFFNMESERRGVNFVTRKATRSAAEIKLGLRDKVGFGNIDSIRDWGYCYSDDTEVLTNNGWKLFKDLNNLDTMVSINPDGYIVYDKPSRITELDWNSDLLLFQNRYIDLLVTPGHKMYVSTHERPDDYNLINASDVFSNPSKYKFKKDGIWLGVREKSFTLPSITKYKSKKIIPEKVLNMDTWLEFLGWYISEGYVEDDSKSRYNIGICQSKKANPEYYNEIVSCIEKLGFKYHEFSDRIRIVDKQLWSWLYQFKANALNKRIPWFIKDLPPEQIMIFLDSLFKGDGSGAISTTDNCNYYTSSKYLADDLQELLLKCGYSTNIKQHKNRNNAYRLNVIRNFNTPSFRNNAKSSSVAEVPYCGKVYCCTVPNGTLYVRRNGKPCWSGNCPDYMDGVVKALQFEEPMELTFATGQKRTVRDMLKVVFEYAGLGNYEDYVYRDMKYYRPSDLTYLLGDYSTAEHYLGWKPTVGFEQMIHKMYDADLKELSSEG